MNMASKRDYFGEAAKTLNLTQEREGYSPGDIMRISAVTEAIKHLQNFKKPYGVTQLSPREIMLFSQAQEIASAWEWDISSLLDDLAVLKMSENRKSREEIKDTLIGIFKGGKKKSKGFYAKAEVDNEE